MEPNQGRDAQTRIRIAQEAARLMADEGIQNFATAKRKATVRLGLPPNKNLPGNQEIEQALMSHQRLFRAHIQPARLRQLRETALEALRLFASFEPRLVGPVLAGTADAHSPVYLHLFAETPEQLDMFLLDRHIPYRWEERLLRTSPDQQERFPLCCIEFGDVSVEMTVFPPKGLRQAPLSPVDGKPMRRAGAETVEKLLGEMRL